MMSTKTRAYTALPELGKRTYLFTIEDFIYDAEKDIYTCPPRRDLTPPRPPESSANFRERLLYALG